MEINEVLERLTPSEREVLITWVQLVAAAEFDYGRDVEPLPRSREANNQFINLVCEEG